MFRKLKLQLGFSGALIITFMGTQANFQFARGVDCDQKCRMRQQFWNCEPYSKGYYYEKGDCYMCTQKYCNCEVVTVGLGTCKQTGTNRYKAAGFTAEVCPCTDSWTIQALVAPTGSWIDTPWSTCQYEQ